MLARLKMTVVALALGATVPAFAETLAIDGQVAIKPAGIETPHARLHHDRRRTEIRRAGQQEQRRRQSRRSPSGSTRTSWWCSRTTRCCTRWSSPADSSTTGRPHRPVQSQRTFDGAALREHRGNVFLRNQAWRSSAELATRSHRFRRGLAFIDFFEGRHVVAAITQRLQPVRVVVQQPQHAACENVASTTFLSRTPGFEQHERKTRHHSADRSAPTSLGLVLTR